MVFATCALLISGASAFHLSAPVMPRTTITSRASAPSMGDQPVVKYGEGSGWCADCRPRLGTGRNYTSQLQPAFGACSALPFDVLANHVYRKPTDVAGSKHTMSGGFESTDTPDFFDDDDEYSKKAKNIDFKDGIMGSQAGGKKPKSTDPGVAGALEVNPDIYVPEAEASRAGQIKFELKPSGMTDQDFTITCDSLEGTELVRAAIPMPRARTAAGRSQHP
jgi:hypothetical protein